MSTTVEGIGGCVRWSGIDTTTTPVGWGSNETHARAVRRQCRTLPPVSDMLVSLGELRMYAAAPAPRKAPRILDSELPNGFCPAVKPLPAQRRTGGSASGYTTLWYPPRKSCNRVTYASTEPRTHARRKGNRGDEKRRFRFPPVRVINTETFSPDKPIPRRTEVVPDNPVEYAL